MKILNSEIIDKKLIFKTVDESFGRVSIAPRD